MSYRIVIDFDGTVVTHEYPRIGKDIGAVPILKRLVNKGHKLILFTMRSDIELQEAVMWFKSHDIPLYGINTEPYQKMWTNSPKADGDISIDDRDLFTPTKKSNISNRPYCDWELITKKLEDLDII